MTDKPINNDPLFTTPNAAIYINSSIPTMERWRRSGLGPDWCKLGGNVRYRRSALDRFIEASTRRAHRGPKARSPLDIGAV